MKARFIFAIVIGALVSGLAPMARSDPGLPKDFPLRKGDYWIYKADVKYLVPRPDTAVTGMNDPKEETVTFKMEVLDTVSGKGFFAALVKGFPFDCGWYDPVNPRRLHVIVTLENGACYDVGPDDEEKVWRAAARDHKIPAGLLDEVLVRFPIKADKDTNARYRWVTEDLGAFADTSIKGLGVTRNLHQFQITDHASPENMEFDFVPGVGIVGYMYHHHGTLADCDMGLIEIGHQGPPAKF